MTEVAVNLLWCRPGQVGGSEEYLARLMAGVAELQDDGDEAAATVSPTLFTLPK